MAKGKKSEEALAQVKRDRLNKHLNEVEELIERWITELAAPSPFYWQESEESQRFLSSGAGALPTRTGEYLRLQPWKLWACRSVYVPPLEQDTASNHILRKHLRKRALWRYHSEWEQRLNRIRELGAPICERATEIEKIEKARAVGKELTEDYKAIALQVALEQALGHAPEKLYSQRAFRGVCYGEVVIEKSANAQQMTEVAENHWQMASELGQSREMLELAQEWQHALALQERMREIAQKAIKSSDILYPCQFCRRLWQE
jgi:hypothetical protein